MIIRLAWTLLIYNVMLCVQLTSHIGLNFFSIGNLALLCITNGAAIFATIASYSYVSWMHAIGPLLMMTQLVFLI